MIKKYLFIKLKIFFYNFNFYINYNYTSIFLIIRLISNFFLIRFGKIPSRRIGHFIIDTNLYIYNLRKNPKNSIDLFCLENQYATEPY